jgi:hypothetical protein
LRALNLNFFRNRLVFGLLFVSSILKVQPGFYVPLSRAEHRSSRRKRPCGCLSASEFHRARRLREAQGSPKGPGARAVSFGSFSFPQKKMNKEQGEL